MGLELLLFVLLAVVGLVDELVWVRLASCLECLINVERVGCVEMMPNKFDVLETVSAIHEINDICCGWSKTSNDATSKWIPK